jgi:MFS family permease
MPLDSAPNAPVAQGIERSPPEREVAGSNPAGRIADRRPLDSRPAARLLPSPRSGGISRQALRGLGAAAAGGYRVPVLDWLRSLNPRLPRSVQMLQLGGLLSALGNGIVLPFTLIYLHNVRGISLGVAGLVLGTLALVGLGAGPIAGALVDRVGGRAMLSGALVFLAVGYGLLAFVEVAWQAFLAAAVAGIGNAAFWPAQSALLATLTPPEKRPATWGMQRIVMNLGIGLGALIGGLVARVDEPWTFQALFLADAVSFLLFLLVLLRAVPDARPETHAGGGRPRYGAVLRHGAFVGVIGLNMLFVFAGMTGIELLPVYAKNEAGVAEASIGAIFFVNTAVIVLAQLPVTKLSEGHRRMRGLMLLGVIWAGCWLLVPVVGSTLSGAGAAFAFALVMAVFGVGECVHGAVQGPLVADLAEPALLGRYMALSAMSWQLGFALGPAVGGFALEHAPGATWVVAATLCVAAGLGSLALEPRLPARAARTPTAAEAARA